MINLPHVDARTTQPHQQQGALVRFEDAAVMFTASWLPPSLPVPRPGGHYRRQYLVHLTVPQEYRSRAFHKARSVTLYDDDSEPMVAKDFGGVQALDLSGITLALYVDALS